ncbi:MAG: choice-of-anchor D domain-containing protein [Fidelibacterota bacterium]
MVNLIVSGNTTGNHGGGIYLEGSSSNLVNVAISGNTASITGGGILCYGSSPSLENVTVSGNSAGSGGGISCVVSSTPSLVNSILWDNSPQEIYLNNDNHTLSISYSDVQGGLDSIVTGENDEVIWGDGNIDADPLFTAPATGDFTLQWGSPAIDAGDPASDPDPDGTIADMGAYYYDQTTQPPEAPIGLDFIAQQNYHTITWEPNTEGDLVEYVVYQGFDPLELDSIDVVAAPDTFYNHLIADIGVINYYAISAVDTADLYSEQSAVLEVSYPLALVEPIEHYFFEQNVVEGETSSWVTTLYNMGSDTLTVDSIYIAGGDTNYFSVELSIGKTEITGSLDIRFVSSGSTPTHRGSDSRKLVPASDVHYQNLRTPQKGGKKWVNSGDPTTGLKEKGIFSTTQEGASIKESIASRQVSGFTAGERLSKTQGSNRPRLFSSSPNGKNSSSRIAAEILPGDSLNMDITFAPLDTGDFADELVIITNDPTGNDSLFVALTGEGVAPLISTGQDSVDFGSVRRDSTEYIYLSLSNPGTDTLHISNLTLSTTVFEANVTDSVAAGDSVDVTIGFTPDDEGFFQDTLLIYSDAFGLPVLEIPLVGEGVKPTIDVTANELFFGSVRRDSSKLLTFDIINSGSDNLLITSITVSGEVFEVDPSAAQLAPAQSQIVTVLFMPVDTVHYVETVTIVHDDPDQNDLTVMLDGQGVVPVIETSENALNFGPVVVNGDSTLVMTVSNIGNDTLTIDSIYTADSLFTVVVGGNTSSRGEIDGSHRGSEAAKRAVPSRGQLTKGVSIAHRVREHAKSPAVFPDFGHSNPAMEKTFDAVETEVPPGESIELWVTFAPTDTGNAATSLFILSDDPDQQTSSIILSGRGVAAFLGLSQDSYDFGPITADSSATQVFTLTNLGEIDLVVSDITVDDSHFSVEPQMFTAIPPQGSEEITATFTPDTVDTFSGVLTVMSNDLYAAEQTIELSGSGIASRIELSASSLHFGNTADSTQIIVVSNTGSDTLQIVSITGVSNFTLSFVEGDLPLAILPSGSATLQVQFDAGSAPGHYSGTATLHTSAFLNNDVTIDLDAYYLAAQSVNFEEVLINRDSVEVIALENSGSDTLEITSTSTSTGLFSASPASSTILPGTTTDITLTFAPTAKGTFADSVIMEFSGLAEPVIIFSLTGEGITYPEITYNSTSFGITTVKGTDVVFDLVLSNEGDYLLDYQVEVDAFWVAYDWLTISTPSGQITGGSIDTIQVNVVETANLDDGDYLGWLYVTSNAGENLSTIVDTVAVNLMLLPEGSGVANSDTTVEGGNQPPFEMMDNQGNSVGVIFDFTAGQGGNISVTAVPSAPPSDSTTGFYDPDGGITNPLFAGFYWEVSSNIPPGFVVDITFDYSGLPGVENPTMLRLAKRQNLAGPGVMWKFLASDSVVVDAQSNTITAKDQSEFSQWTVGSDESDNSFVDTQAPTIGTVSISPTAPGVLESVVVTASVTDESALTSVNLFYLVGGGAGYSQLAMTDDGGGYSATIPSSEVTLTGLAYFIKATDEHGFGSTSDTLGIPVKFPASSLASSISGSPYSSGFPKNKWRMIAVPADLDDKATANTIGDEFAVASSNTTWQLFRWTGTSWTEASSLSVGESYWLYQMVGDNVSFTTGSGTSIDMAGAELTIKSGWNLISSPYAFRVAVNADQSVFYGPLTYGNGSEGWTDVVTELAPWAGYAIYNRTTSDKILTVDPTNGGGSIARLAKEVDEGWLIQLQATSGNYSDVANYVGRLAGAEEMLDQYDNPEPPYIDGYVSLSMDRPEWGTGLPLFTSDVRSSDEVDGMWDIDLHVRKVRSPVTIAPEIYGTLPAEFNAVLFDLLSREQKDLLAGETALITDAREDFPYHLKVIAGSPDFVDRMVRETLAALPEKIALHQNYPNPFNPTTRIAFALPRPEKISLKIVNLLGQEVVTLTDRWYDLGYYEVVWDGKDALGQGVASGMYISALTSGDKFITRKMLLLR